MHDPPAKRGAMSTLVFRGVDAVVAAQDRRDNNLHATGDPGDIGIASPGRPGPHKTPNTLSPGMASRVGDAGGAASTGPQVMFLEGRGKLSRERPLEERDPRIGEDEMATIHPIRNHGRCFEDGMDLKKWLVASLGTDTWMLILLWPLALDESSPMGKARWT